MEGLDVYIEYTNKRVVLLMGVLAGLKIEEIKWRRVLNCRDHCGTVGFNVPVDGLSDLMLSLAGSLIIIRPP